MPENIFTRTARHIGVAIEEGLGRLEELSGPALMRQAVRETGYTIEKLENARNEATNRLEKAVVAGEDANIKAQQWSEKAKYALSKGRDDLAETASEMQQDAEKMAVTFSGITEIARAEAELLKTTLQDMYAQKEEMQAELEGFLKNKRQAEIAKGFDTSVRKKMQATLDKFESVMDSITKAEKRRSNGTASTTAADSSQRKADIEEQLAELKKTNKSKGKSKK